MPALLTRRRFLQQSSLLAAAATVSFPAVLSGKARPLADVRLGFIGVGLRGRNHVQVAMNLPGVVIKAIADPDPDAIARTQELLKKGGRPEAVAFPKGDRDFENLLRRDDVDAVIVATPWEWHTPQAVAAMKAGKPVGLEVPSVVTLKDAWELVNTHEKTGVHLMCLENVCYRRDVMAVLNMVRQGVLGDIVHVEGGYEHDLREVKFNDGKSFHGNGVEFGEKARSEARWRTNHSVTRNGDLYPTHGLGPVAEMIDLNRGNLMTHLTSYATKSTGLHKYIVDHGGENHPNAKVNFKLGDIVTTQIACAGGQTILLTHDTNLPRPYSLGFRVQGNKGLWMDVAKSIYVEGVSKPHQWDAFQPWQDQYDHPYWKNEGEKASGAGHGGMDYFVVKEFVESVREQKAPPMDVYDAAAWSAITPLSEASIAAGSKTVSIPDFTRGKYKTRRPVFALA